MFAYKYLVRYFALLWILQQILLNWHPLLGPKIWLQETGRGEGGERRGERGIEGRWIGQDVTNLDVLRSFIHLPCQVQPQDTCLTNLFSLWYLIFPSVPGSQALLHINHKLCTEHFHKYVCMIPNSLKVYFKSGFTVSVTRYVSDMLGISRYMHLCN